jgi:hypothetical protein
MSKLAIAALTAALALGVSSAFAQEASGAMSGTEMASGTMAKHPTANNKMKRSHTKKDNSMGMKHEASGAMGQ